MQCPACARALIVPEESAIDPVQNNILASSFRPMTVALERHCEVCGQPAADSCPLCGDRKPETVLPVMADGEMVLAMMKNPDPNMGMLLRAEERALFVAEMGFHRSGDVVQCEFVSGTGERTGCGLFTVKDGAPLVAKRRLALYRMEPVLPADLWEYCRKRILGSLEESFMRGVQPAQ